jgi:hypothetical protein
VHEYVFFLEACRAPLIASVDLGLSSYCVKATPATCKKIYTVASGDYCSKIQTSQSISNATMYSLNPWLDAGCGQFLPMPSFTSGSLRVCCRSANWSKRVCWMMTGRLDTRTRSVNLEHVTLYWPFATTIRICFRLCSELWKVIRDQ